MGKKITAATIILVTLLFCIYGCNRDSVKKDLVGVWLHSLDSTQATAGEEFRADGTYRYWYSDTKIRTEDTGTYKVEGKRVTVKVTKHVATSGKVTNPDNGYTFSVLKVDDHELKMLVDREVFILTRQK